MAVGRRLRDSYPQWRVSGLSPAGAGLTFDVLRGDSPVLGPVAIRVSRQRTLDNSNDQGIDTRDLLRHEARLAEHARRHGVPTPRVHAMHLGDDVDFLVMEYVASDGSPPSDRDLGVVTARVHGVPPPAVQLAEQGNAEIERCVAERLTRRLATLSHRAPVNRVLPDTASLEAIIRTGPGRRSLLHMDIRPANVLTRQGRVVTLIDWANALVGDPGLELARIAEYGHLNDDFLAGYGQRQPPAALPHSVEIVYRLDTAVMLANVFHSERMNASQAERQASLDRVLALLNALDGAPG